jgi:hypothetical protein
MGTGIVGGALALPGLGGAASVGGRMLQAGATAGGYSAAHEFFDSKDPAQAAIAGGIGFGAGAVAQPGLERVIKWGKTIFAGKVPYRKPDGSLTHTAEATLRRAGIDPAEVDDQLDDAVNAVFGSKGVSDATAREVAASEFKLPISAGQATGDFSQQQFEQAAAKGAFGTRAQKTMGEFFEGQRGAIDAARSDIGRRVAGGEDRVGSPFEAGEMVAERAREIASTAGRLEQGLFARG